ncbi:MAG: DUF3772 domain-containing protein, partial [Pseudomonadota bacterium]
MRAVLIAIILWSSCSAWAQPAEIDDPVVAALAEEVSQRAESLSAIEQRLTEDLPQRELLRLRDNVRELRRRGDVAVGILEDEQAKIDAALGELGAAPEEGAPEEPEVLREQRQELTAQRGAVVGVLSQAHVNQATATQLIEQIALGRRQAFTGRLFARGPLLIVPETWRLAWQGLTETTGKAHTNVSEWAAERLTPEGRNKALVSLSVALAIAALLYLGVRRVAQRLIAQRVAGVEALQSRRIMLAGARTVSRMAFGLIVCFFISEALRFEDLLPVNAAPFVRSVWVGILTLLFADGVSHAFVAAKDKRWQILPLDAGQAILIRTLVMTSAIVLVLDLWLVRADQWIGSVPSLVFVQKGVMAVVLSVLLLLLARKSLWESDPEADEEAAAESEEAQKRPDFWKRGRFAGRAAAVFAILAAIAGFAEFGHFLATRSFALLALMCAFFLLRSFLREAVRLVDKRFSSEAMEEEDSETHLLYYWTGVALDLLAALIFIPFVLVLFGAAWADVRSWVSDAFFGFRIGQINISVAKIVTAVAITAGIVWVTRSVQNAAEKQLFPRSRIDVGVQNSLKTLIGYVGLVIAVAFGISALGFDFTNLAIIAGALSVGIGFGLQSIVGNFVSGLILLFERPVKVGDWVVTSAGEGIVKKISVRSTEIETFDR